jgi:hypothetical protein
MLFVLGVGYALQLPYFSLWKTLFEATPAERARLFACDALQVIALCQLLVIGLQGIVGARWTSAAGVMTLVVLGAGPAVWAGGYSARAHPALAGYLDASSGSHFPFFPFGAFVLAGTVAGAALGRQDPQVRHRRALLGGLALLGLGTLLALLLHRRLDFWTLSPAYVALRLGGLVLLLMAVEKAARCRLPGLKPLALLGHETLLVFVLHLYLLYGWILGPAPLGEYVGRLQFTEALVALLGMLPVLLAAAWLWHALKVHAPREASLSLAFVTTAFLHELLTRPW